MGKRGVIAGVVVVAVLVGGAAVADGVVRERTEERVADELRAGIPGLDATPDVTIDGFPFLTQVLAGSMGSVVVTAPSATFDGLRLDDVDVRLTDVSTSLPTTAGVAEMTADVSLASIQEVLDVPVDLTIEDNVFLVTASLFGVPLTVTLTALPAGRTIEVEPETVSLGGLTVSADDLPAGLTDQIDDISIPVESLPEGMELTGLTVGADGVTLEAWGTDVVFDELPS